MALHNYIFTKKVSLQAYLFLCLLFPFQLIAGDIAWELNEDEQRAYHFTISLQLNKATSLLKSDRPGSIYLANLGHTIELLISDDPNLFEKFEEKLSGHLAQLEAFEGISPYKNFYIGEIYLHSALTHLKFGEEWSAIWDFRRAYKIITSNIEEYPAFLPNYKSAGLLQVILGSVPERYQWIPELLGMEGNIADGLNAIQKIADSDNLFNNEANALSNLLAAYLLNRQTSAVDNFKTIYANHSENKLYGYLYLSLLMKNAQSEKALTVFKHLQTLNEDYLEFNFLNYLGGELYLQKGDYTLAETYYSQFVKNSKGKNFIKDAHYKRFLTFWLSGENNKAIEAHRLAQKKGSSVTEADKHAAKSLAQPEFPHPQIMKLRLLTDGGYYTEALSLIEATPPLLISKKDRVEYDYRKARLYHNMGDDNLAIALYLQTIENSGEENWYFAPNSHLQLGYIYEEKGDQNLARHHFTQVLTFKSHEYKTSLDNKAKVALASYEQ